MLGRPAVGEGNLAAGGRGCRNHVAAAGAAAARGGRGGRGAVPGGRGAVHIQQKVHGRAQEADVAGAGVLASSA